MQPLDYIFSVEILNEGVDIVEVNQVIMLRPTAVSHRIYPTAWEEDFVKQKARTMWLSWILLEITTIIL